MKYKMLFVKGFEALHVFTSSEPPIRPQRLDIVYVPGQMLKHRVIEIEIEYTDFATEIIVYMEDV